MPTEKPAPTAGCPAPLRWPQNHLCYRPTAAIIRHYQPFLRYLVAHLRPELDAASRADLCAEISHRIHRGLPNFRGESTLTTWVRAIARYTARAYRSPATLPLPEYASTPDYDTPIMLHDALRSLPAKDQAALLLPAAGVPLEQVARQLDIPTGTLKARRSRLRRKLGEQLGERQSGRA